MANFSKGIWEFDTDISHYSYNIWAVGHETVPVKIATIAGRYRNDRIPVEEREANGRLIAAAPDMYKIIKNIQEICHEIDIDQDIKNSINEVLNRIHGQINL